MRPHKIGRVGYCCLCEQAMGITYHVAGPADDEDFAQAEYLAELLMASLKGVDCVIHAVLPEDWPSFVSDKSAYLGCKQRAPRAGRGRNCWPLAPSRGRFCNPGAPTSRAPAAQHHAVCTAGCTTTCSS